MKLLQKINHSIDLPTIWTKIKLWSEFNTSLSLSDIAKDLNIDVKLLLDLNPSVHEKWRDFNLLTLEWISLNLPLWMWESFYKKYKKWKWKVLDFKNWKISEEFLTHLEDIQSKFTPWEKNTNPWVKWVLKWYFES